MEVWKDVPGYEGIYEVSNLGRVRTHKDKVTMDLKQANLGQLYYLARFTKYRNEALIELDRRVRG